MVRGPINILLNLSLPKSFDSDPPTHKLVYDFHACCSIQHRHLPDSCCKRDRSGEGQHSISKSRGDTLYRQHTSLGARIYFARRTYKTSHKIRSFWPKIRRSARPIGATRLKIQGGTIKPQLKMYTRCCPIKVTFL